MLLVALSACDNRSEVPYGACASSDVCAASTPRCISFANTRSGRGIPLCSALCTTNADCADNGLCIETMTPSIPRACIQRCNVAFDCNFTSAICPVVQADGAMGCVP